MRKECKKRDGRPKARQTLGKSGRCLFPYSLFWAELAMCQRCGGRTAEKDGDVGKDAAGSSGKRRHAEEIPQRCRQPKREDRTEMKKEGK